LEVGTAGPSESILLDDVVVTVPGPTTGTCDPLTDLNFCQGGDDGACMTGISPSIGDFDSLSGCPDGGGTGETGGTGSPGFGTEEPVYGLPGDADGDGDTWDDGPGAWIMCISAILGMGAGAGATYFALEDYHYKVDVLNAARLRLDHYTRNYGAFGPEYLELDNAFHDAEREARIAAGMAATGLGVTIAALIGAGVVCAPLIIAPTL
jgi:hypothetical protein